MKHHPPATIETVSTAWREVVIVCGKCSKKLDGGFGPDGDDSLGRALKRALRDTGRRRTVRVIESKCLGLCPKGAVTVLPGGNPGTMLTVPGGTAASDVAARITIRHRDDGELGDLT